MRFYRMTSSAALLGAALVFGGGECAPAPDDDPPAEASSAEYVAAMCDYSVRCQAENGVGYPSEQTCVDVLAQSLACGVHVTLGGQDYAITFVYSASAGAECARWLRETSCDQDLDEAPAACQQVVAFAPEGATVIEVGDGEACGGSSVFVRAGQTVRACGRGLFCESSATEGVCSVCRPYLAEGDTCGTGMLYCGDGLYCDTGQQVCAAVKPAGEACGGDSHCRKRFCRDGVCADPLARGEACTSDDTCRGALVCRGGSCGDPAALGEACATSEDCQAALVCSGGTCQPYPLCERAALGQPCNGWCVETATCDLTDNVCVALAQLGAACTQSFECVPGATCSQSSDTCVAYAALGASCGADTSCDPQAGYCDYAGASSCVAYKDDGEACAQSYECTPGWCDGAASVCSSECTMP